MARGLARACRSRGGLPVAVAGAAMLSCTLALDRSGQCTAHADCQALDPNYVCGSGGVCVPLQPSVREVSGPTGNDCRRDGECAVASVCRDGFCRPIEGADGRCVLLEGSAATSAEEADVLLIGLLSSVDELGLDAPTSLERAQQPTHGVASAVSTALAELNRARKEAALLDLPPLVGVACNENDTEQLEYLLDDLQVRLLIGPTSSERVELAAQRTRQRALLLPPFADGPELELGASGLVLSCRPNRRPVLGYFLAAVAEARRYIEAVVPRAPLSPALLVSADVATESFASGIDDGELGASGVRRLTYGDRAGVDLVGALMAAEPPVDLVIAASVEDDWASRMAAYDAAYFASHGDFPYYLLADKRARVIDPTLADVVGDPPRYLRFLGLDYERGALSQVAGEAFAESYQIQLQRPPEPALEYAYDCTYVAVYSAVAAGLRLRRGVPELGAEAVLAGLGALQGGLPQLVGARDVPGVLAALAANRGRNGAVDLIGASGELSFPGLDDSATSDPAHRYLSVAPPNGELYCVDANSQTLCDTGIVFPIGGGPPASRGDGCACLRAR